MKTVYAIEEVSNIIKSILSNAELSTISPMSEGHSSQVFRFSTNDGEDFVFRIRDNIKDLNADKFIYDSFSANLPLPKFIESGQIDEHAYYAITKYVDGIPLNKLSTDDFAINIKNIRKNLAATFQADISQTNGYGAIDYNTGSAQSQTWKESLTVELRDLNPKHLRNHAASIGLEIDIVDRFIRQLETNLPLVSETRRLLHGDPGGDNVIVKDGTVVALLDWEQMAYGDWIRDFSRFEYWGLNDYGDMSTFGNEFSLEIENIHERKAVYWAIDSLRNVEFAGSQSNIKVSEWLRANVKNKLI